MESRRLLINGKFTHYLVYEDGRLWSELKGGRFILPQVNSAGYILYNTTCMLGKAYLAHTLVAMVFIGACPDGMEVNHKDLDKRNNHWRNLEWVTHGYNIRHARKAKPWDSGRKAGFKMSAVTKGRMAKAKHKGVRCFNEYGEEMFFTSIEEFCGHFGTYRKKFNRIVSSGVRIDGWWVQYADGWL